MRFRHGLVGAQDEVVLPTIVGISVLFLPLSTGHRSWDKLNSLAETPAAADAFTIYIAPRTSIQA